MGNVLAASSAREPPKFGVPPPEPSSRFSKNTGENDTEKQNEPLENPGTVEEIHKKCRDIQAMPFEGAKIMLNKGLSNHFQVSHTINLCTTQPSGYKFGATYVGTKQIASNDLVPVLLGEIDPSGNLNANIYHNFSTRLRCKFASQIQSNKMVGQLSADYKGDAYTVSLTLGNPNLANNSGVIVAHYLQSLTKRLALGTELAYQYGQNVPGGQFALVAGVGRYTSGDSTWSAHLSSNGLQLCYYQKASEQLQIGVELETSARMQESVATICYQVDLPKADLVFRGSLDSNWNVCGVLEKKLQPLPFAFALSGRLNHTKNQFRLGCGLIIG